MQFPRGLSKTLAARGISQLGEMLKSHAERAPLKRNVDPAEVGGTAAFSVVASGFRELRARRCMWIADITSWDFSARMQGCFWAAAKGVAAIR